MSKSEKADLLRQRLVCVLLVIFIITTPEIVNNLEMLLPSGKPPPANPDAPKPKVNKIVVNDKGQTFLNEAPVTVVALKEALKQMKAADPELGVAWLKARTTWTTSTWSACLMFSSSWKSRKSAWPTTHESC